MFDKNHKLSFVLNRAPLINLAPVSSSRVDEAISPVRLLIDFIPCPEVQSKKVFSSSIKQVSPTQLPSSGEIDFQLNLDIWIWK